MYLRRIELQGFKTFAGKTALEFSSVKGGRGITAVVGPNGSGKSNIADAIRWVMGEQSMKLLRGKKTEDVIFSGSAKKSRSGFAEVTMMLENDGNSELDMTEIVITRRLYRDGTSEYEINRQAAKLSDVILLLAQAGLGQRTYSVIGQGMVDAVLSASPAERKEFFDEAAGLKPFQLKRHQSVNKLETSKEHIGQAEALLGEIGPRMRTLERQVKRLEQKEGIERERETLERTYFGGMWHDIFGNMTEVQTRLDRARGAEKKLALEAESLERELGTMEKEAAPSLAFETLQASLETIANERMDFRERQAKLGARIEIAAMKAEKPWTPMPMSKILETLSTIDRELTDLVTLSEGETPDMAKIKSTLKRLMKSHQEFLERLQKPAPESAESKTDPSLQKEIKEIAEKIVALERDAKEAQAKLQDWKKKEEGERTHVFETQRKLSEKRSQARDAEKSASEAAIELARWETRSEQFMSELRTYRKDWEKTLNKLAQDVGKVAGLEEMQAKLGKLRSQLEWIGSIDPETIREYKETKERFDTLTTQVTDLQAAIRGLDTVIRELDLVIRSRSETAFHILNSAFDKAFKTLFGGGEAKLLQVAPEEEIDEEGNIITPDKDAPPVGIDIQATPPGKRLKAVALLSGGERALTSIALISAIMATNPSPFIVLDEVDAALDESNSKKFADIIHDHADKTQFIIVTHNRATMNQAHVLYGVTLADDGTSQLLSVKLEELTKQLAR